MKKSGIIGALNFRRLKFDASRHFVVNLISTITNEQLINMINSSGESGHESITKDQMVKTIPLPGVKFLSGKWQ